MDTEKDKSSPTYIYGPSAVSTLPPGGCLLGFLFVVFLFFFGRFLLTSLWGGILWTVDAVKPPTPITWRESTRYHPKLDAGKAWGYSLSLNELEKVQITVIGGRWSVGKWGESQNLLTDGYGLREVVPIDSNLPVDNVSPGSLIGQFGDEPPFLVGNEREFITDEVGILHLGINDLDFSDNIGSLELEIILFRP